MDKEEARASQGIPGPAGTESGAAWRVKHLVPPLGSKCQAGGGDEAGKQGGPKALRVTCSKQASLPLITISDSPASFNACVALLSRIII